MDDASYRLGQLLPQRRDALRLGLHLRIFHCVVHERVSTHTHTCMQNTCVFFIASMAERVSTSQRHTKERGAQTNQSIMPPTNALIQCPSSVHARMHPYHTRTPTAIAPAPPPPPTPTHLSLQILPTHIPTHLSLQLLPVLRPHGAVDPLRLLRQGRRRELWYSVVWCGVGMGQGTDTDHQTSPIRQSQSTHEGIHNPPPPQIQTDTDTHPSTDTHRHRQSACSHPDTDNALVHPPTHRQTPTPTHPPTHSPA